MKGELHIFAQAGANKIIPLQVGTYSIGRGKDVAIQIESRQVSRRHAEIIVDDREVRLLDCGSANGTELNGRLVTTGHLHDGDRIRIGEVTIEYHAPEADPLRTARQFAPQPSIYAVASRVLTKNIQKRTLRSLFTVVFSVSLLTIALAGGLCFRSLMVAQLEMEAMQRAQGITRYLAEKNREDLRVGNELLLDVDSALKERGVREAYIIDKKGKILAPTEKLNQIANDPFTMEALEHKTDQPILPSPLLNGVHTFVHPIRAYNDKLGRYEILGVAKIQFSPKDAIGSMQEANRLLYLIMACAIGLAVLLGWAASRALTTPILELAEKIHLWRSGQRYERSSTPFRDWAPLYDAVDLAAEEFDR